MAACWHDPGSAYVFMPACHRSAATNPVQHPASLDRPSIGAANTGTDLTAPCTPDLAEGLQRWCACHETALFAMQSNTMNTYA